MAAKRVGFCWGGVTGLGCHKNAGWGRRARAIKSLGYPGSGEMGNRRRAVNLVILSFTQLMTKKTGA